ncbi:MAG TPA: type II secretion system protein GspJ [Methylomirabilota bacterium]|nr:type II secretion system protein GspJ [Methylomirabilota bacterium]
MSRRDVRGFTLLELLIALAIVAALLAIAFGGLRVALAAWTQGEDRAGAHQHLRGIAAVLGRAVGSAYPYRASRDQAPDPVLLFQGKESRLELVTQAPPFPTAGSVAFSAVAISLESTERGPALVIRQRVMPNREPFTDAPVMLEDTEIDRLEFRYLDAEGTWQEEWDGEANNGLPRAVRITLVKPDGRGERTLALTVALRMGSL